MRKMNVRHDVGPILPRLALAGEGPNASAGLIPSVTG
jgi:hypothetical protein